MAAYARTLANQRHRNVGARRPSRAGEPGVHRSGSAQRVAAAGRNRGLRSERSAAANRRPHGDAIRRIHSRIEDTQRHHRAVRDEPQAARVERGGAPERRVSAPEPRDAGTDDRAVESGGGAAGRGRRRVPAAGVLRVLHPAGQLRRTPVDSLWLDAADARDQSHELRPAHRRRPGEPGVGLDDSDGLAAARAAGELADRPARGARLCGGRRCCSFGWRLPLSGCRQPPESRPWSAKPAWR